ncbi:histidine kinase [Ruegeria sp. ANG-S4]|uniref:ATP-binding response regulator n=1 Tax=Ruegeria sp. ANG-S4 TaxID=1577904 RepID=UPI00057E890D|nr:histidine kinase [Ruegeria sp. ANG-S4]
MLNTSTVTIFRPRRWRTGFRRSMVLTVFALTLCCLPFLKIVPQTWSAGFFAVGLTFLASVMFVQLRQLIDTRAEGRVHHVLRTLAEQETDACFFADSSGKISFANSVARSRFGAEPGGRLDHCLRSLFANPPAILLRLQSKALGRGSAREDVANRDWVIPVKSTWLGGDLFFWRISPETEQRWKSVAIPVLSLGRSDVVVGSNDAAQRLFGRPAELSEVLPHGSQREGCLAPVRTKDGDRSAVVSTLRHNGAERDLIILPVSGDPTGHSGVSYQNLPVPMMRISRHGEIEEMNSPAARLIGEDLSGKASISDVMQGLGHSIEDWLARTVEQDLPPQSEFLRLSRKDQEVFVQVTLSKFVNDGRVGLIAVLNDATELKTLEAQFVQGQKMQAVGQLAGGVAHDFNNLLTAISGHCDLLLLRHDQNDPNYGDLVQINQNANRAAALVSQLLAFSRKQNLRPEVLDLRDTISDLIHLLNRLVGEKVRLVLSHDPILKPVRADKRQLEQVLMNLVVNARDAMPEGGDIRIETEVLLLDQPMARSRATVPPGEYVTVKVIDSGVGIPPDKVQKVFEPFYTTKRTGEGTGLGLSTVYGIVKQTGGFIFVDSIPNRGTEFTVFLPVCCTPKAQAPTHSEMQPEQSPRQGEGVVLLVEDEAPVRAFATRALRLKGYTVLDAASAEEALRLLEDKNLTVDVFVTDVVMPGMDGPTWVRRALETRPDVRVIFMSGYTEGAFGETVPEIPNSTFLPKPFSLTQLTEAVFQQLS